MPIALKLFCFDLHYLLFMGYKPLCIYTYDTEYGIGRGYIHIPAILLLQHHISDDECGSGSVRLQDMEKAE